MSTDAKVAKELVETLKDGRDGFATAADKLQDGEQAQPAQVLSDFGQHRAGFTEQIVQMGHEYGDDVDESGSVVAAVHRGWLSVKDALTGDDPPAVPKAAVTGRGPRRLRVRRPHRSGEPSGRVCLAGTVTGSVMVRTYCGRRGQSAEG